MSEIKAGYYHDGIGKLYVYGHSPVDGKIVAQCVKGEVFAHTGDGLQYLGETLPSEPEKGYFVEESALESMPDPIIAPELFKEWIENKIACQKAFRATTQPETIDVSEWWVPVWGMNSYDYLASYGRATFFCLNRDFAMKRAQDNAKDGEKYGVMRVGSTVIEVGGVK